MTLPRTLRTLAALGGATLAGLTLGAPAGAQVPDVPAHCHDLGAFTTLSLAANGRTGATLHEVAPLAVGDQVTVTWTTAPGCEAQWHWISPYNTASLSFDPAETQERLVGSMGSALGTGGSFTYPVPDAAWPDCRIQLDHHTGPLVPVIDETHRLNAPAFGLPGFDELIGLGVYIQDDDCTSPPTTTPSTPSTTPSTTTAPSVPVPSVPRVDEPLTPSTTNPPTSTQVTATTPLNPTTTAVQAVSVPPEQLPFTGDHTGLLASIGAATAGLGLALVLRARKLA